MMWVISSNGTLNVMPNFKVGYRSKIAYVWHKQLHHVHTCQQICCNKSWPRKECGDFDDVEFFWCPVILRLRDRVHFQLQVPSMSPPMAWEVLIWCREAVPFNTLNDSTMSNCLCVCGLQTETVLEGCSSCRAVLYELSHKFRICTIFNTSFEKFW